MSKTYFVANWKMEIPKGPFDVYLQALNRVCHVDHQVIVCPSFPYLPRLHSLIDSASPLALGAQNCAPFSRGAYTGEVSAAMLSDAGCEYVLVGHSERRTHFGEVPSLILKKIQEALSASLTPLVCVGETLEQRRSGQAKKVIAEQIEGLSLYGDKIIVAYEPVWAIGTGLVPTVAEIADMHAFLAATLLNVPLLYGGSVKPDNANVLLNIPGVQGVLVGGASLEHEKFCTIIGSSY